MTNQTVPGYLAATCTGIAAWAFTANWRAGVVGFFVVLAALYLAMVLSEARK